MLSTIREFLLRDGQVGFPQTAQTGRVCVRVGRGRDVGDGGAEFLEEGGIPFLPEGTDVAAGGLGGGNGAADRWMAEEIKRRTQN